MFFSLSAFFLSVFSHFSLFLILTGRYAGWVPVGSGHHPDYQPPVPAGVGCGSGDSQLSLALYWNPTFMPFSEVTQGIRTASVSGQSTLHLYLYCKDAVQVLKFKTSFPLETTRRGLTWAGWGGTANLWEDGGIPAVSKGELGISLHERNFK